MRAILNSLVVRFDTFRALFIVVCFRKDVQILSVMFVMDYFLFNRCHRHCIAGPPLTQTVGIYRGRKDWLFRNVVVMGYYRYVVGGLVIEDLVDILNWHWLSCLYGLHYLIVVVNVNEDNNNKVFGEVCLVVTCNLIQDSVRYFPYVIIVFCFRFCNVNIIWVVPMH